MGSGYSATPIVSGYNLEKIGTNFNDIESQLDRSLSRYGVSPNSMEADLDLNSNDILNGGSASFSSLMLAGTTVTTLNSVPNWEGAWTTSTSYVVNDIVNESGNVYICLVDHTSGTFSTDLSSLKWELFASKGSAGAGSGDLLAANNLSDLGSVASARANLLVPTYSGASTISGNWTFTGNQTFNDNVKVVLGNGTDGSIYSDGSDIVFEVKQGQTWRLKNDAGHHMARFYTDSGWDLSFNNSVILSGDVGGPRVTGDLSFVEQSDHASTPIAGRGYVWVKDDTPNKLKFTDDAGTDFTVATTTDISNQIGYTSAFKSTGNSYTNGGTVTIAHGLGSAPTEFSITANCTIADAGYTVGSNVKVPDSWNSGSNYYGATVYADATNVYIIIGSQGIRTHGSGGSIGTIWTPANWELTVRAWL